MTTEQTRRYEMLVRVRDFGSAHADLFPEPSLARQTFVSVGEAVRQLNEHTVSKMAAVQGTTTKAVARAALHERLVALSQTARVIAVQSPGLEERFLMPNTPSDLVLLTTARVFAHDAEPLEKQFVDHAMPKTFLADLREATGRFEQAIHNCEAGRDERAAARAAIAAVLDSGLSAVRALDAMVANRLRDDPTMMVAWKRARRLPRRPRPVKGTPVPGPTPTAVVVTSANVPATVAAAVPVASSQPANATTPIVQTAS